LRRPSSCSLLRAVPGAPCAPWLLPAVLLLGACQHGAANPGPSQGVAMPAHPAASITDGVERKQLANGLTVLVKRNTAAPVVAVVTHVKTGYFHEPDEVAGISHVIEHMFFNGTPTRPGPEDISRETRGYGGVLNAGTIYDRTSYYVVLPNERWREGLAVQADALQNPLFDPEVLDNEMKAILQEARRKLDNPMAYGREKMFELAFDQHRMRRWRIGTEEVLTSLTREHVAQWFADHYRPQNVILSVVGDVDTGTVFAEIEKLYGGMEKGHLRKRGGPAEPEQDEFRYRRLTSDLQRSYVFLGFRTPGEGHRDNPALDMLATILGTGRSSRLESRLKEQLRVVTSIGASSYQYEDVGIFEVYATTEHGELDRAPREIFVELERMRILGPTEDELQRARSILETGEAAGLEEVLGQASTLAAYEARGGVRLYDRELEALRRVDAADVRRVANTYLQLERASLLEYTTPQQAVAREEAVFADHIRGHVLASVRNMAEPVVPEPARGLRPREQLDQWSDRVSGAGVARRTRFELPRGATLIVEENPTAPTVAAGVYFRGGRIAEYSNISGITQLMQRVMVKETMSRDAEQLAAEIEALGTQIGRVSGDDWFGFTVSGLAARFPHTFDVLFDVVSNPRFSPEQVSLEARMQAAAIKALEDQPGPLTMHFVRNALYSEHPYGLPELGLHAVVQYLAPDRLEEHFVDSVRPEAMVIVVSGDVDADAVLEFVRGYAENWRPDGARVPSTAAEFYRPDNFERLPSLLGHRETKYQKDLTQTSFAMVFPAVPVGHSDVPVFDVLQAITGGLGGTFFEEVRGKRGLAYQVATFNTSRMLGGYFGTLVACSPDKLEEVRELLTELHNGLALDPPADEAILRAQNSLAGAWKVGGQTNAARIGRLALLELSGQDLDLVDTYSDRVRAVTREDVARVAQQYFLDRPFAVGLVEGNTERDADPR
jgi:zinc protease